MLHQSTSIDKGPETALVGTSECVPFEGLIFWGHQMDASGRCDHLNVEKSSKSVFLRSESPYENVKLLSLAHNLEKMEMDPTARKPSTRSSNARKHPGVVDLPQKRCSPAEMATERSHKKKVADTNIAAELVAPGIIASIEDAMASADKDEDKNATHPAPAGTTHMLHRTHAFQNLEKLVDLKLPEGKWLFLSKDGAEQHDRRKKIEWHRLRLSYKL